MTMRADWGLLPPGARVLCAVSGGADSMALLHLLWSQRAEKELEIFAAHYEHGLRGEESLRDAAFVEDWCRAHELPCAVGHGDAAAYAVKEGLSVEDAARRLRYAFLEATAQELGCTRIATAHNAEDNAETLLLHLCRGSGTAGLAGIPPQRGKLVRPLLKCSRAEILAYLEENALPHVEDSSNEGDDYARNLLRHQVTPVLRQLNPAFTAAAGRTAELLRQDEDCLKRQAEAFIREQFDGESLPIAALAELHPALSSRVLRSLCGAGLEQKHVDAALALCEGSERALLDLPGQRLLRERGRLYVRPQGEICLPERELRAGESLTIPEAGLRLTLEPCEADGEIYDLLKTYCFKSASICGKMFCTGWKPGDRLRIAGRGCSKSLRVLFREAGLSRARQNATPVIRDEAGILAVHGLALAERALARPGEAALRLRAESL